MKEADFFEVQSSSSKIKALIISEYFPKYCKIIQKKHSGEIRYLDLFAGPGFYGDNMPSTPILVGEACAKDPALSSCVRLMFNDKMHSDDLHRNFARHFSQHQFTLPPRFGSLTVGEDSKLTTFLQNNTMVDGRNKTPTLLFIDPFGYKGVETKVLADFMKNWGNEIFLFVNIKRIHPALLNERFDDLMLALFPTTINEIRNDRKYKSNVQARISLIIQKLADEYKAIIGGDFWHTAFKFQEEDNTGTSHYILHFTKHHRGFDLVKQIYNEFDNVGATLNNDGTYTYDSKQLNNDNVPLFDHQQENIHVLRSDLLTKYSGRKISANALFEDHQKNTNFSRKHYTDTLRYMVTNEDISAKFTDDISHQVRVLISKNCLLEFR